MVQKWFGGILSTQYNCWQKNVSLLLCSKLVYRLKRIAVEHLNFFIVYIYIYQIELSFELKQNYSIQMWESEARWSDHMDWSVFVNLGNNRLTKKSLPFAPTPIQNIGFSVKICCDGILNNQHFLGIFMKRKRRKPLLRCGSKELEL